MRCMRVLLIAVPLLVGGCDSDPEIAVRATLPAQGTGPAEPIVELPVRLVPYDRDSIIAALQRDAPTPEPQVPPELLARIDSLQNARPRPAGDSVGAARERTLRTLRAQVDSIRTARREWSTKTLAGFDEAVRKKLETLGGKEELADTTDAAGAVTFRAPAGRWWVYARYLLPDRELYWNVPIEIVGDRAEVQLSAENTRVRPSP